MIDLDALFELCMYITSYNEPDYQPHENVYTGSKNSQNDLYGYSTVKDQSYDDRFNDKRNEFWLKRF